MSDTVPASRSGRRRGRPGVLAGFTLVCGMEVRRAARRPRLFVMNIAIPLLLVTPIALGAAPAQHAAAVYAVMFVLFGTFGSAIPLLRDAERGLIRRFALTPVPAVSWLAGRAIGNALLDVVQLGPALLVVLAAGGSAGPVALLVAVLVASLVVANVLGVWVAAAARSVAEGALFAAVTALMLLHASGVFRTPLAGSAGARVEAMSPFRSLHEMLLGQSAGSPIVPVVFGAVALLVTALIARPLLRRLAATDAH